MTFLQRKEEWREKRSKDQPLKSSLCSKNTSIPVTLHWLCHQGPRDPVSRFCTVLQESQATELCPWLNIASIKQIFRGNFFKYLLFLFFFKSCFLQVEQPYCLPEGQRLTRGIDINELFSSYKLMTMSKFLQSLPSPCGTFKNITFFAIQPIR